MLAIAAVAATDGAVAVDEDREDAKGPSVFCSTVFVGFRVFFPRIQTMAANASSHPKSAEQPASVLPLRELTDERGRDIRRCGAPCRNTRLAKGSGSIIAGCGNRCHLRDGHDGEHVCEECKEREAYELLKRIKKEVYSNSPESAQSATSQSSASSNPDRPLPSWAGGSESFQESSLHNCIPSKRRRELTDERGRDIRRCRAPCAGCGNTCYRREGHKGEHGCKECLEDDAYVYMKTQMFSDAGVPIKEGSKSSHASTSAQAENSQS